MTGRESKQNSQDHERHAGGRPRKFAEPSQPITITLPKSTLRQLELIDPDRGRAIVKLAQMASWEEPEARRLVEIVQVTGDAGLVIVAPTRIIKRIPFVQLVEVAPGRFLLALAPGHGFHQLEIALTDLLDEVDDEEPREREIISQLLGHLKNFRKAEGVSMAQILLVRMKP